ncbi:MAG: helix-turn-helix domain-containing protein [Culicoidibacterales bacterium]
MENTSFNHYRLKAERIARNITCEEMSIHLGFKSPNNYQQRESGRVTLKVDEFAKIMKIFQIELGESGVFFEQGGEYTEYINKRAKKTPKQ